MFNFDIAEVAWNGCKVCFALSPLIGILALVMTSYDDTEEEKKRRKKKADFQLGGGDD
eukprot:gene137-71_t